MDAGHLEGATAPSRKREGNECLIREKVQNITAKKESPENIESGIPLLDFDEPTTNEIKRKDNSKGENEIQHQ